MKINLIAKKIGNIIAGLALIAVIAGVNSTCEFIIHQPKLPTNAKKLRKF